MTDLFHALAAPARRAILDELHDRDGQTLFELCTRLTMKHELGLSRQAISQHLEVLEAAGILVRGNEYAVPDERVLELAAASGCNAYDCEFVALAEGLSSSLVTSDRQVLKAFPERAVAPEVFAGRG